MSYTQPEDEAGTRLTQYNDGAWDPATNPLGFDAGGNQAGVFTRMLKDVALFLRATVRIVTNATSGIDADVEAASQSAGAAALSAQAASNSADRAAQFDPAAYATRDSPALTGNPTAPTPAAGDNDASIATTAFVQTAAQSAADAVSAGPFTFAYAFR